VRCSRIAEGSTPRDPFDGAEVGKGTIAPLPPPPSATKPTIRFKMENLNDHLLWVLDSALNRTDYVKSQLG